MRNHEPEICIEVSFECGNKVGGIHTILRSKTKEMEKSIASYDEYGRQIDRIDKTGHGYPDTHTDPHRHKREYGPGFGPKGKETYEPMN